MIKIEVHSAKLTTLLEGAAVSLLDATPMMAGIVAELISQTDKNFAGEGRPKWKALEYPRPPGLEGLILNRSGAGGLTGSIQGWHGATEGGIGSNKPYAAIHQFGGQTKAHTIKARRGKALAFGGTVVKQVQHPGSKIPPRPYLPVMPDGSLQPEAEQAVLEVVQDYLRGILDG